MPKSAERVNFDDCFIPNEVSFTPNLSTYALEQEKDVNSAIMNLFLAVAIADQKFLEIEATTCVEMFKSCFNGKLDPRFIEEYDFVKNAEIIKNKLNGPGNKYWLGTQYMRLRNYPNYQILLEKLWKISVCDGKLDSREAEIIDFFAYFWRRKKV